MRKEKYITEKCTKSTAMEELQQITEQLASSSGEDDSSDDDDNRIRERLAYDIVKKKCPEIVVSVVYEELKKRPEGLLYKISATDFMTICDKISNYINSEAVCNKRIFVRNCLDKLVSGTGCRGKPKEQLLHFEQKNMKIQR